MDRELERATREELLAVIAQQGEQIQVLRARVAELEAKLGGPGSVKRVPEFIKPRRQKREASCPRKRRAQAYVRRRETPTRQVEHALDECRGCGCHLEGGSVKRTRQVIHIPIVPVEVVEHVYLERRCPVCGLRNVPRVDLGGEVVGKNRLSSSTMALIASLREVVRLPVEGIRWLLATVHQLRVSKGEIIRVLDLVAQRGRGYLEKLLEEIRASAVVHADETGWREDGQNGYLWSFSTPRQHYLAIRQSRASEVVREVLGEDFSGVLVSDFYSAYNFLDGPHQRCWVHLLRDIHELEERHPQDESLAHWAEQVHGLYREARAWAQSQAQAPKRERMAARQEFEERILALARPYLGGDCPQRVLCQRIDRFLGELFTFVELLQVPPDNNAAERALRPQVLARNISGGTRSAKGSRTKAALASMFSTWQLQGLNPFLQCQILLNSP